MTKKPMAPLKRHHRLLEEACLNHPCPIKHKLKDCDMIKNFMTSGSRSRSTELEEAPGGSNSIPFLGEDTILMVYDGRPHQGGVCV
jgi:hypothetical protein